MAVQAQSQCKAYTQNSFVGANVPRALEQPATQAVGALGRQSVPSSHSG